MQYSQLDLGMFSWTGHHKLHGPTFWKAIFFWFFWIFSLHHCPSLHSQKGHR